MIFSRLSDEQKSRCFQVSTSASSLWRQGEKSREGRKPTMVTARHVEWLEQNHSTCQSNA
jgi:hypothetical protein